MAPELVVALLSLMSTVLTNRSNRSLAAEQRDWNESMQDKMNAYNRPDNQVQRLREAGISPNSLAMGQGMQVSGNTSADVNGYQLPSMLDPMQIASNSLLNMMSAKKAGAEAKTEDSAREVRIKEIMNHARLYEEQIGLLQLDQVSQQIANEYAGVMNEVAVAKSLSEIGINQQKEKELASLTEKNLYELKNVLPQELQLMVDKHELNLLDQQEVVARIHKFYTEAENFEADTALKQEQTFTEIGKQEVQKAQVKEINAAAAEIGVDTEQMRATLQMYLETYEQTKERIANESKLSKRQVQGFWINTILHGVQATGVSAGAALGGVGAVIKAAAM